MNKLTHIVLFTFFVTVINMSAQSKRVYTINDNWQFHKGDLSFVPSAIRKENRVNTGDTWEAISIPHTWNNTDTTDDTAGYYRGVGWYKKTIHIGAKSEGNNNRTLIYFEGVNQVADVYVNEEWVGKHQGGYTKFHFDITALLNYGKKNILAVKVDNSHNKDIPPLSADFTFFGGIYRDVFLMQLNDIHFSKDDYSSSGVFITTPNVSKEMSKIQINCLLSSELNKNKTINLINRIVDKKGNIVSESTQKVKIKKHAKNFSVKKVFSIDNPSL